MNEKHEDRSEKESEVYWSFRCEGCGFVIVKLCNDIERCPFCNGEFKKTFYQY
jgi:rubrerythrin